jgi:hypothetical protein
VHAGERTTGLDGVVVDGAVSLRTLVRAAALERGDARVEERDLALLLLQLRPLLLDLLVRDPLRPCG